MSVRAFTGKGVMKADGQPRYKCAKDGRTIYHFMVRPLAILGDPKTLRVCARGVF